jgi:hypothetical protein
MYICRPVEQFSDLTENAFQEGGFRNFGFHERRLLAPCAARVNKRSGKSLGRHLRTAPLPVPTAIALGSIPCRITSPYPRARLTGKYPSGKNELHPCFDSPSIGPHIAQMSPKRESTIVQSRKR